MVGWAEESSPVGRSYVRRRWHSTRVLLLFQCCLLSIRLIMATMFHTIASCRSSACSCPSAPSSAACSRGSARAISICRDESSECGDVKVVKGRMGQGYGRRESEIRRNKKLTSTTFCSSLSSNCTMARRESALANNHDRAHGFPTISVFSKK